MEYAYNNMIHSTTGKTPFEVIEGKPKPPLMLKMRQSIFVVDEYVRDIKEYFEKIKEATSYSQQRQKKTVYKHRRALEFNQDYWVCLRFSKARFRQTVGRHWQGEPIGHQNFYAKVAKHYYGPFQILERINETFIV